jgi:hypothetical protein
MRDVTLPRYATTMPFLILNLKQWQPYHVSLKVEKRIDALAFGPSLPFHTKCAREPKVLNEELERKRKDSLAHDYTMPKGSI